MSEIRMGYGAINKPLKEQANEQGYELRNAEKLEKIRFAINMCGFHVATQSQIDAMTKKLHKQVMDSLVLISD